MDRTRPTTETLPLSAHRRHDESTLSSSSSYGYNVLLDCLCYVVQEVAPEVGNAHEVAVELYHAHDHRQLLQLLQYRALPTSMRHLDEERGRDRQTLQTYITNAQAVLMVSKNNSAATYAGPDTL